MKHIKKFNEFLNENLNEARYPVLGKGVKVTVAKDVKYFDDAEFEEIILTNGHILVADEDTGGEGASMNITDIKLKKGDVISFDRSIGYDGKDSSEYFDTGTIIVNGKKHTLEVGAHGGNSGTILAYEKL